MSSVYLYRAMGKKSLLTVRLEPEKLLEFQAACDLRGVTMSSWTHQFIVRTIREEKDKDAEEFKLALERAREKSKKAKKRAAKRKTAARKIDPESLYEHIPQTRLFSDGTGKPITGKKLSRKILADIEDATNDAIERTNRKLKSNPTD